MPKNTKPDPAPDSILPARLPDHLQKLIDLLPLNVPVHRSTIDKAYGRPNYARRIRKIIHEYGWDIERRRGTDGANDDWYTRKSAGPIRTQRIRQEVKPALRKTIYERDNFTCAICRRLQTAENLMGIQLQCDHKIPAERGGGSDAENLQTLCTECNLKKRQTCKHCKLKTCSGCPFAFPELYACRFTIHLTETQLANLRSRSQKIDQTDQATLQRILIDALDH